MLQISAKNLGMFSSTNYCKRCAWIKLHQKNLPWQIFPGIFSSIDSWSKKLTHGLFKSGTCPHWLSSFGQVKEIVDVPHWSKFKMYCQHSQITLTGVPDEIVRFDENTLGILDYKTARYTNGQDALLPIYKIQLNAYRLIAQKLGYGHVIKLGLIYFEPCTDHIAQCSSLSNPSLPFSIKCVEIEILETGKMDDLLCEARMIYDQRDPPAANSICKECKSFERIRTLLSGSHDPQP